MVEDECKFIESNGFVIQAEESTQENDTVDIGSTDKSNVCYDEQNDIDSSKIYQGLSKEQEEESVRSRKIKSLTIAGAEKSEVRSFESKIMLLSKQQDVLTMNIQTNDGHLSQSNVFKGRYNEIKPSKHDSHGKVSPKNIEVPANFGEICFKRSIDNAVSDRQIHQNSDNTNNDAKRNELIKTGVDKEMGNQTDIHVETNTTVVQNESKKNEKVEGIAITKSTAFNHDEMENGLHNGLVFELNNSSLITEKWHCIAHIIGYSLRDEDKSFLECDRKMFEKLAKSTSMQTHCLSKYIFQTQGYDFSALQKHFSCDDTGLEKTESFVKDLACKKHLMLDCKKNFISRRPLLSICNGCNVYTVSEIEYPLDQKERIEITTQMESHYCVQIADVIGLHLPKTITLFELLVSCQNEINMHYEKLNTFIASLDHQVKLLAVDSKELLNILCLETIKELDEYQRISIHEGNTSRKEIEHFLRKYRKFKFYFQTTKKGLSNTSNFYETDISSDECEKELRVILYTGGKYSWASNIAIWYNQMLHSTWYLLIEIYRFYVRSGLLKNVSPGAELEALKSQRTRPESVTMNEVRAEYFESALRESATIQLKLTFTNIYILDNRIPTAVPIYLYGYIHSKDMRR